MLQREAHVVTSGKRIEAPQNVIYFDSESWVNKKGDLKHSLYLICANFCRYKKRQTDYWRDYLYDSKEFWNDVCKFAQYKTTTYIYAHNMGYDLIATQAISNLGRNGFRLKSFFEKGGTFIYKFHYEELDEEGNVKEGRSKTLMLLSTTNYYACRLADLGKIFGSNKLQYDFNGMTENEAIEKGWTMEEAINYCRQDVNVIKIAMEHLIEFILREELGSVAKTAAGQSFNAFRHKFMKHEIYIHDNENAIQLEREAYYGGRVECWRVGELKDDDFYYIDVNSMYPYVMKKYEYPVRLLGYSKYNTVETIKKFIAEKCGVIAKVKIKTKKPYFPKRYKNKLIFPVGEFYTYLTTPELEFAIKYNLIVEVGECSFYEMAAIFEPFVDYFYNARLKAKAADDEIHSYLFKLIMNSNYGKWGQLSEDWRIIGEADFDIIKHEVYYVGNEKIETKTYGGTIFQKEEINEAFNSFPAISAHVTAQARMHLLDHIIKAGFDNVYYMDTDSLFINSEGYNKLLKYLDDEELGKMKIEDSGEYVKINAPKDYYFRGVKKTREKRKGISSDARQLTMKEFCRYIEQQRNKLTKKQFTEFIFSVKKEELTMNTQWPKMASFLNIGDVDTFFNINRIKHLKRYYNKGIVLNTGKVLPFEIFE